MDNEAVTLSILTTMAISLVVMGIYFPNHQFPSSINRPPIQTIVSSAHNVAFEPYIRRAVPMMAPTIIAPVKKSSLASSFAALRPSDILCGVLGLLMFVWLVVRLVNEDWHSNLTCMFYGVSDPDQWNAAYDERMMAESQETFDGVFTASPSSAATLPTGASTTSYWCEEILHANHSFRRLVDNLATASQQFMRSTGKVPVWPSFDTGDLIMILNGQLPEFQEIIDLQAELANAEVIKEQQTAQVRHLEGQVTNLTAVVDDNNKVIEASLRRIGKLEDGLGREKDSHARLERTARFLFGGICVKALVIHNLRSENRQQAAAMETLKAECTHMKTTMKNQESELENAKLSLSSTQKLHQAQGNLLGISQNDLKIAREEISRLKLDSDAKAGALLTAQTKVAEAETRSVKQLEQLSTSSTRLVELEMLCEAKEHESLVQQQRLEQLATAMDVKDGELQAKNKLYEEQRALFNAASAKNRNAFLVHDARYENNCWKDALRELALVNEEAKDIFDATECSIQEYRALDNAARYDRAIAKSQEYKARSPAPPKVGTSSSRPVDTVTSGTNVTGDPTPSSPTTRVDADLAQPTGEETPCVKLPPQCSPSKSSAGEQLPPAQPTSTGEQEDEMPASQPGGDNVDTSPAPADPVVIELTTPANGEPTSTTAEGSPRWRKKGRRAVQSSPLAGGMSQSRWADN